MDKDPAGPTRFGLGVMLEQDWEGGVFGHGAVRYGIPAPAAFARLLRSRRGVGWLVTNTMGPYVTAWTRARFGRSAAKSIAA